MGEILVRFTAAVSGSNGKTYLPQACGGLADDGLWEGWIEFLSDSGSSVRTPRETEQPNRDDLMYWAQGLSEAYLEGALSRALAPRPATAPPEGHEPSMFPGPASGRPVVTAAGGRPVLDPFATFLQGEDLLRRQLGALSRDNLVNIVKAYAIDVGLRPDALSEAGLVDGIVTAVRQHMAA